MSDTKYVDINNLGLEEEELGSEFNAESNAFAGLPPIPKGKYIGTLSFRDADPGKQFTEKEYNTAKTGKSGKYEATKLVTTVTSPAEFDKRKVFDDFISTGLWNEDDTSKIASLLHLLGRSPEVTAARTHRDLSRALANAIAGQPSVGVVVDWEGRIKNAEGNYETIYKTMTQFRQRDDGTFDPVIRDAEGKEIGRARTKVKAYFAAPSGANAVAG